MEALKPDIFEDVAESDTVDLGLEKRQGNVSNMSYVQTSVFLQNQSDDYPRCSRASDLL